MRFFGGDTITNSNYHENIILVCLSSGPIKSKRDLHISFRIMSCLLYLYLFLIEIRLKNVQNLYFISNFLANVQCYVTKWTERLYSGRSKGGARDAPPLGQNFFIFMQFSGKIRQIVGWCPPFRVGAPPLGNLRSATVVDLIQHLYFGFEQGYPRRGSWHCRNKM